MKTGVYWKIALKYLWRYRRRYLFLFLALGFGFGVLTVVSSLKDGMKENLYLSAQSHYVGDIIALGHESESNIRHHLTKTEQDIILAAAEEIFPDPVSIAVRTSIHGMDDGSLFYNGNTVPLKYVVGVDWEAEKDYFDQMVYTEEPNKPNDNSIILSLPIAQELGIQPGDSLTLGVKTKTDQKNTGTFVVSAIVKDSNFFGYYKVFVSRIILNRLVGFDDQDCSLIGFVVKDRKDIEKKRIELYAKLQNRIQTGPLIHNRDDLNKENGRSIIGIRVLLLTLPVYLSEVSQLMGAIDLASYVLFAMMLAIIGISAAVTCRLILHERTRETGTMRAIGFYERDMRVVLQLEIVTMAFISMAAGFFLGMLINRLLSFTSFSWFPGFEVFMQNGRLGARYQSGTIVVNIIATGCMLALAIEGQIYRNSRSSLPEMLSGGVI